MIRRFFRWNRFACWAWLVAAGLLLSACESSQLPFSRQGRITPAAPPPAAAAQATPPARTTTPPPVPSLPEAPAAPSSAAHPTPQVPSLAPLLSQPGVAMPDTGTAPEAQLALPPPSVPRVALLLPLTGPQAELGKALLNAAQLALFDFADNKFELLVRDTGGTPDGAQAAAQAAIGDGASLILGPLLAPAVRAVTPAARAANVPVVAFSSDRAVAGNGIFTMGFYPEAEVRRVVSFAQSKGITRFAALVPSTDYGDAVVSALYRATEAGGAQVTRVQYYDPQNPDVADAVRELARYNSRRQALKAQRAELEKRNDEVSQRALKRLEGLQTIGDLPFQALLIADGGKRLQAIAAHLPFYDIDPQRVRMLGTGQWDVPGVGAEPALVGGWFAAPTPKARADFEAEYTRVYGKKPPRLTTLAYDATALAAVLARQDGGTGFSIDSLTSQGGFYGRDGIFRFDPDGLAERGLAVLQVERQGFTVADPAPTSFAKPTN